MSLQSFGWAPAFFCLVLLACSTENPVYHSDGDVPETPKEPEDVRKGVAFLQISTSDQPGRVGAELHHPLEVRITDSEGVGVENMPVIWTVASGEGVLDDLWTECPEYNWEDPTTMFLGDPIPTTTVHTDAEGFARVRFTPTWFGVSTITAEAAGIASPKTFTVDASDPNASLKILWGNDQEGPAHPFPSFDSFGVGVRDGEGNKVPHVRVNWSIKSGDGQIDVLYGGCPERTREELVVTRTQTGGITYLSFRPFTAGTHLVAASVAGLEDSSVIFQARAVKMVIGLSHDPWINLPTSFFGPQFKPDNTVPVGTPVEFWNREPEARIISTSAPPHGSSFDSGPLGEDDRFLFIPEVAGTWEFHDQISGARGTLTVQKGSS